MCQIAQGPFHVHGWINLVAILIGVDVGGRCSSLSMVKLRVKNMAEIGTQLGM